jgi:hypothetical protein
MIKNILFVVGALLTSTAMLSAAPKPLIRPNGVIFTPGGVAVATERPTRLQLKSPAAEPGLTKIFDNLSKYPDGVYSCCTSFIISGPNSDFGQQSWIGAPFTPNGNFTASKIVLGLGYDSGTNKLVVTLNGDSGGLPGEELASATVSGLPDFPGCCAVAQVKFKGVPVSAGQQYWVVVKTSSKETLAGWAFNDTEQVAEGNEAFNDGTGWQPLRSLAAAGFEVLGK